MRLLLGDTDRSSTSKWAFDHSIPAHAEVFELMQPEHPLDTAERTRYYAVRACCLVLGQHELWHDFLAMLIGLTEVAPCGPPCTHSRMLPEVLVKATVQVATTVGTRTAIEPTVDRALQTN